MKITNLHANLILFIMYACAGVLFYNLFYPFDPVEMTLNENGRLPISQTEVEAGKNIVVTIQFTKKQKCTPEIEWFLVDGFVMKLSEQDITRPIGDNLIHRTIKIPESAPAELVHLRIQYRCHINAFRTVDYEWDSEDFVIRPSNSAMIE